MLSGDKPLINPIDDKLGYAPFAKYLADGISKMAPPEGIVIAVYAPWGMGKTTVLNFVANFLEQKAEDELIIMQFNPWWFDGHENLTKLFFSELHLTLDSKLDKAKENAKDLLIKLGEFGNFVSKIPTLELVGEGVKTLGDVVKSKQTLIELKTDVEKLLETQQKRVLVIVDDIDRLTADEISQLFRVIKAVADFPNVIYLLTFDRSVVADTLGKSLGVNGLGSVDV
jgi:predicted KAP-like P-loop ATPase